MRILAIDYGQVRVGIAVSDPLGIIAQPVKTLVNDPELIENIKKIVDEFGNVAEIIVGLPKSLSGELGPSAQKVLAFVETLKSSLTIPIKTIDERLTTKQAEKELIAAGLSRKKRKTVIDQTAAVFILQNYLNVKSV